MASTEIPAIIAHSTAISVAKIQASTEGGAVATAIDTAITGHANDPTSALNLQVADVSTAIATTVSNTVLANEINTPDSTLNSQITVGANAAIVSQISDPDSPLNEQIRRIASIVATSILNGK